MSWEGVAVLALRYITQHCDAARSSQANFHQDRAKYLWLGGKWPRRLHHHQSIPPLPLLLNATRGREDQQPRTKTEMSTETLSPRGLRKICPTPLSTDTRHQLRPRRSGRRTCWQSWPSLGLTTPRAQICHEPGEVHFDLSHQDGRGVLGQSKGAERRGGQTQDRVTDMSTWLASHKHSERQGDSDPPARPVSCPDRARSTPTWCLRIRVSNHHPLTPLFCIFRALVLACRRFQHLSATCPTPLISSAKPERVTHRSRAQSSTRGCLLPRSEPLVWPAVRRAQTKNRACQRGSALRARTRRGCAGGWCTRPQAGAVCGGRSGKLCGWCAAGPRRFSGGNGWEAKQSCSENGMGSHTVRVKRQGEATCDAGLRSLLFACVGGCAAETSPEEPMGRARPS